MISNLVNDKKRRLKFSYIYFCIGKKYKKMIKVKDLCICIWLDNFIYVFRYYFSIKKRSHGNFNAAKYFR